MEDTRITFETAKLAKEKGFPQEPNRRKVPYYNYKGEFNGDVTDFLRKYLREEDTSDVESVSAPTQSLLAKWLREKHGIDILVQRDFSNGIKKYILTPCFDKPIPKGYQSVEKNNYEEAYEIGLQEALKLI